MNKRHLDWRRHRSSARGMQSRMRASVLLLLWLLAACAGTTNAPTGQRTPTTTLLVPSVTQPPPVSPSPSTVVSISTHHYEYVFPDGEMDVYDMDHGQALVQKISLPTSAGVRGVVASPVTHMLYVSYGSDSGAGGSLLKYDLLAQRIVWQKTYVHGIDSMAITPDGQTIYMPDGELSGDDKWYLINAQTGTGPHNTLVSLNGKHVYLGSRFSPYLTVVATATNQIVQKIGPLRGDGSDPLRSTARKRSPTSVRPASWGFKLATFRPGAYSTPSLSRAFPGTGVDQRIPAMAFPSRQMRRNFMSSIGPIVMCMSLTSPMFLPLHPGRWPIFA